MKSIILSLIAVAILFSGIFAVTTSTLMQSIAVLLIGAAALLASVSKLEVKLDRLSMVVSVGAFLYFLVRALLSPVYDLGVADLFLFLPAAGVYFLFVFGSVSRKHYFWVLVFVMCGLGLMNLLMFIEPLNEWRDSILPFARGNEESGLYNHRNFCSNMIMMVLLVSLSIAVWFNQLGWKRIVYVLLCLGCLQGLLMAPARGGFIGLIGGLVTMLGLLFIVSRSGVKKKILFLSLAGIFAAIAINVGLGLLNKRNTTVRDSIDFEGRKYYFAMAVDQFIDGPFVGSGSMSYSYLCYQNWGGLEAHNVGDHVWVHNEFLQVMADYGGVGALFLMLFLMCGLRAFLEEFKVDQCRHGRLSLNHKWKLMGLMVIVGFLVNGSVSFPAHAQPNFLVFAFLCSLLSINSSAFYIEKLYSVVARIVLLSIGITSIFLGIKELRALVVFAKHGIYVDNANWDKADDMDPKWFDALNEVSIVAPNYLRSARLANMRLKRAGKIEGETEAKRLLEDAVKACDDSLERHPFYAVALATKADCFYQLGDFESAKILYNKLVEKVRYRQRFFYPYEKQARNLAKQAQSLGEKEQLEEAKELFIQSSEALSKSAFPQRRFAVTISSWVAVHRTQLLMKKRDADLDAVMVNYYDVFLRGFHEELRRAGLLYAHGLVNAQYAELKFMNRQPGLALKHYNRALECYYGIKKNDRSKRMRNEMHLIQQRAELLRRANITPAK